MGIWENLGMGGYRGFSRPSARLLQQAVQLAGDLGWEQAGNRPPFLGKTGEGGGGGKGRYPGVAGSL